MFINKIALTAALILRVASAALASDIGTNPSDSQSAREWAAYPGQTQSHKDENVFVSNTYDSPDWAPVYAGPAMRQGPSAGGRDKSTHRSLRVPSRQPSSTSDRLH